MKKNYWENLYKSNKHRSIWPWNDVIKLTKKFYRKKNITNILELGCGFGANIPFFLNENFNYHGIDFSPFAIKTVKKNFPSLKKKLYTSDLNKFNFNHLEKKFDLIIDRGTTTHLKDNNINKLFAKLPEFLNAKAIVICCSLYSEKCDDRKKNNTNYFSKGIFKGVGYINFFNKKKLNKIFSNWDILHMEEVTYSEYLINKKKYSYWNLVLRKK